MLRRTATIAALLIIVCGMIAAGTAVYFYFASPPVREAVNVLASRMDTPDKAFPNEDQINILLMGRDLDRDPHGRIVHTRGRTDTMMLAHIDFRNPSVSILSIPRDTLVRVPGYRGKRRISYANALGGPELAQETVSELLGLYPKYYVLVNFEAFEEAIDAIGGLEVTVDKKLEYDDNWGDLHIHLNPGKQALNGEQAMGFVRYRQSKDGDAESDLVRIRRQQELLRSAREKFSSAGLMFKAPKLLDIINDDMEGNVTPAQMMCLAHFLRSLPPESDIRMETLPALDSGGVFVRTDVEATRKLVSQMFLDGQR